jgi:hypothetical protein
MVGRAGPPVAFAFGMTRLDAIALRQKKSFVRDALFAVFVGAATVISIASLHVALLVQH